MSWDASGFEMGAQWYMTPDGQWHTGASPGGPGVVTGHVVKVDKWGVTIADGPPPPAVVKAPAPAGAPRPNRRERRAAAARAR